MRYVQEKLRVLFDPSAAERHLRRVLYGLSGFYLLLFLYTALRRMSYPFELEWIEDGMLLSMRHIALGHGLYGPPTLEFTPFLYGPLFLYVSAALSHLTGIGYTTLRLVSMLATLGVLAVIYKLVERETKDRFAAVLAAGLYVALYGFAEAFFDIGRVDSLFTLTLFLALYSTLYLNPVLTALLWLLAFETKQTALPIGILILLLSSIRRPRRGLIGAAMFLVFTGVAVLVQNRLSSGWYGYYTFGAAHGFPVVWRQVCLFFSLDLFAPLGIACVVIVAALLWTRPSIRSDAFFLYASISLTLYGIAWFLAGHWGTAVNAFEPAYAWTATLFGIGVARLLTRFHVSQMPPIADKALAAGVRTSPVFLLLAAATIQFASLLYNPGRFLPTVRVRSEREQFIAQLHAIPGDVYLVDHNADALMAGKKPHAEMQAMSMVLSAPDARSREFAARYEQEIASQRFSAIVTDLPIADIDPLYLRHYPLAISAAGGIDDPFLTSQPKWILLPCSALHNGLAAALIGPATLVNTGACQPQAASMIYGVAQKP